MEHRTRNSCDSPVHQTSARSRVSEKETHIKRLKLGANSEVLVVVHILGVCHKGLQGDLEVGI